MAGSHGMYPPSQVHFSRGQAVDSLRRRPLGCGIGHHQLQRDLHLARDREPRGTGDATNAWGQGTLLFFGGQTDVTFHLLVRPLEKIKLCPVVIDSIYKPTGEIKQLFKQVDVTKPNDYHRNQRQGILQETRQISKIRGFL